jgi:hypothetical protein
MPLPDCHSLGNPTVAFIISPPAPLIFQLNRIQQLELNRNTVTTFFDRQALENSIALLGAAAKGDEEVCVGMIVWV